METASTCAGAPADFHDPRVMLAESLTAVKEKVCFTQHIVDESMILCGSPGRHRAIMFLHCLNRTIDPETVKEG